MARVVKERCIHCLKVMRNDGSETEPKWVCDNPECTEYKPKEADKPKK